MDTQKLNYEIHFSLTVNGLESESVNERALELALNNPRLKDSIRGAAMSGVHIPLKPSQFSDHKRIDFEVSELKLAKKAR